MSATYKTLIRQKVEELKNRYGRQKSYTALAQHCRIQKTYLSQVLSGKANLSPDQAFLASQFLEFTNTDQEYFLLLHQRDIATDSHHVKYLQNKINSFEQKLRKTEYVLERQQTLSKNFEQEYYLNPTLPVLHMALNIHELRRQPEKLAVKLGISTEQLEAHIQTLIREGLAERKGPEVFAKEVHMHIQDTSLWNLPFQSYMRNRALRNLEKTLGRNENDAYHFGVCFTADQACFEKLQKKFLAYVQESQSLVTKADSRVLTQMSFDLFAI